MSEGGKSDDGGKAARKARERQRLAAALRENLKRRKAQTRGRPAEGAAAAEPAAGSGTAGPHDSAGFAADKQSH
jgi:hypothetical protein